MTKCPLCHAEANFYFSQEIDKNLNLNIDKNTYYQCSFCKFTFSKSMYELDEENFTHVNKVIHTTFYKKRADYTQLPPYLQQALLFHILAQHKVINKDSLLDYAAGLGEFSRIAKENFSINASPYDEYLIPEGPLGQRYISKKQLQESKFSTVFSSAFLEHIRDFSPIDEMMQCLDYTDSQGIFAFHTLVCENPPKDPHWFYYSLLHCSVFSNKSMQIFMDKYNFKHSLYSPTAKTWLFFKKDTIELCNNSFSIKDFAEKINKVLQFEYFFYKEGFMDYWK